MSSGARLGLLLALWAGAAGAESVSVLAIETHGLSEGVVRRCLRGAEAGLQQLSSHRLTPADRRPTPRRGCAADPACVAKAVRGAGTQQVLLLSLSSQDGRLLVGTSLVDAATLRASRRETTQIAPSEAEEQLKLLVGELLPPWGRKGWGAVRVSAPEGAVVKIDGRKAGQSPLEPLSVAAGTHSVDVLLPSGAAVLSRVSVPEGQRQEVAVDPAGGLSGAFPARAPEGSKALRRASYGLFAAGALAIAGSLLAGAASRQSGAELAPCGASSRDCLTWDGASAQHERAEGLARTGNILLGAGSALAVGGAGLFVFDWVRVKDGR